jgi:C1A family cysteine protease
LAQTDAQRKLKVGFKKKHISLTDKSLADYGISW